MKKLLLIFTLVAVLGLVSGCATAPNGPVMAPIVMDQKGPVAGFDSNASATKVGKSEAEGILIFSTGDASIQAAAANGGISRIHHVDSELLNVLGIYSRYETIVYGE